MFWLDLEQTVRNENLGVLSGLRGHLIAVGKGFDV